MNNKPESLDDFNESEQSDQAELNRLLLEGLAPIPLNSRQHESLRQGLMERVTQSIAKQAGLLTVRWKDGVWQTLKVGIRVKQLGNSQEGNSVLIEFAPGSSLSAHRHNWLEEGIVLRGGLQMGELNLGPFDYHVSPPGSRHAIIQSRQGALAYLRGTSLGDKSDVLLEMLSGLLPPFGNNLSRTVFANQEDAWLEIGAGVLKKNLWSDDTRTSRFYRLQPGARMPEHTHLLDEECMMLEGEVFLGDLLLRTGDYHLAPAGTGHGEIYSDVGATLFIRGARDC